MPEVIFHTLITAVLTVAATLPALAQATGTAEPLAPRVLQAAQLYVKAIACAGPLSPSMVVTLVPAGSLDMRWDARYAVIWGGDLGCQGGSGTHGSHIAMVVLRAGDSVLVDPIQSSPAVRFPIPVRYVERVVSNTADTLTMEGMAYSDKDPNCCPSLPTRFTMRVDEKGDWRLVSRTRVAPWR
jgi:hypothetical protein